MSWPRLDFVDVSAHQGAVDWPAVPVPAIVKATEGTTFVDPAWPANASGAAAAGRLMGAYHFLTSTSPGRTQADNFVRVAGPLLVSTSGRVAVLDWERDSTGAVPDEATAVAFVERFREVMPEHVELWLYGSRNLYPFAQQYRLPLWVAWYPSEQLADRVAEQLESLGAVAWQWTSTPPEPVPGFSGRVDLNTRLPRTLTPSDTGAEPMTITPEDAQLIVATLLSTPVKIRDGVDPSTGQLRYTSPTFSGWAEFVHAEAKRAADQATGAWAAIGTMGQAILEAIHGLPHEASPAAELPGLADALRQLADVLEGRRG